MSIEIELRDMLVAAGNVSTLVGSRIFPAMRIEDTPLPAVVYTTRRSDAEQALAEQVTLAKSNIRYECIATTLASSRAVAEAVRQAIAGTTGALGSIDRSKLNVKGSSVAIGHPFAATGARIVATLAKLLATNAHSRRGLISVCTAGGMGVTAILERA